MLPICELSEIHHKAISAVGDSGAIDALGKFYQVQRSSPRPVRGVGVSLTSCVEAATITTRTAAHLRVSGIDVGIGCKQSLDDGRIAPQRSTVKRCFSIPVLCIRESAKV
jgi:hypothetical protein